jgi:hypothetical protein
MRNECKPSLRRNDIGHWPKHLPKTSNFDSQPDAMRFIDESRSESAGKERVSRSVAGPRLA